MKKKKKKYFMNLAEKHRGEGVTPPCQHFPTCGGCMFEDLAYENQLNLKKDYINKLMDGIVSVDSVYAENPLKYRNRMDLVTAFGKSGLREAGSFKYVVDVESCEIMQDKANNIFKKIKVLLKNHEIQDYNYLNHEGYLRYVIIRQAYFTKQLMVNFVIAKKDNRLQKVIDEIIDEVDSISLILSDGLGDVSFGEVIEDIKGGFIEENFEGISYRITPNSFFQSNSVVAVAMYKKIKEHVTGRVLDLYSGVGSITLFVADKAETVVGVETIQEAVDNANVNKQVNKIENVEFICEDAFKYVKEHGGEFDTLIIDPPRMGMNPKMVKYVNEMKPPKIVYMSCNPATFKENLEDLVDYEITSFEAFDMFPQTPHLESLAILERKK